MNKVARLKQLYKYAWRIERFHWRVKVGKVDMPKDERIKITRLSLQVPAGFLEVAEDQLKERNSYQVRDGFINRARAQEFQIRKQLRSGKSK